MNYWFWLLIILVPIIVFSVKPEANIWIRIGRLVLAAVTCYALLFWTVSWQMSAELDAIHRFIAKFPECSDQQCANSPRPRLTGPILGVVFVLGWIPAAGYSGFCELIWRVHYRTALAEMGTTFKGKWFSNALIIIAVISAYPTWIFLSRLAY